MRNFCFIATLLMPIITMAHVGSPNVFFEGRAGNYSVYVVVRPPAALPGIAQVSVRVDSPEVSAVSLQTVEVRAGREGAPPPVSAQHVLGETNLWSGEVWFLHPGSYSLHVSVVGPSGTGEAMVPVNALGGQRASEPLPRTKLNVFAVVLLASALWLVSAVARQGLISPGSSARGGVATVIAVVCFGAGVAAVNARWRKMDFEFQNRWGQKPEPVKAAVRVETNRTVLQLEQGVQSMAAPSWEALVPDHGKLMHLFLVREPELNVFTHLHPVRVRARSFSLELPPLPAGEYQLYGDITYENGLSQTLVARVQLPQPTGETLAPPPLMTNALGEVYCGTPTVLANQVSGRDMDDSWHMDSGAKEVALGQGRVARMMGGYNLLFENESAVAQGRDESLRFAVFAPDGNPVPVQLYMGMAGHAAVRHADGSVFAHLHPSGSFSMASQEVFRQRAGQSTVGLAASPATTNRVSFPYQFPKAGTYRIWIQVRVGGRVLTGVFNTQVKL